MYTPSLLSYTARGDKRGLDAACFQIDAIFVKFYILTVFKPFVTHPFVVPTVRPWYMLKTVTFKIKYIYVKK